MRNGEITAADVQAASSQDGLRQLLAHLGYDVSDPVDQTAASLGIAERVQHQVLHAQRVATQRLAPGGPSALDIYAFEVSSLTADLRKAVATSFRDKPANVLLILTTRDHDPLDFVLVQKALRQSRAPSGQVAVSHQLLSVDRRNPSRVHLRVLERMRNKAADPYAQFERIVDAFKFAEWSEDEFNNRNLFSDYFLKHRLPIPGLFAVWEHDVKPARQELDRVCGGFGAPSGLAPSDYGATFIEPVLAALDFDFVRADVGADVDYLLRPCGAAADEPPCAGLLAYPWDRPLDRRDDRARDRADDVPGIRVVKAIEQRNLPWAILTNGRDWRLYCAKAHSRASNYYEIDLPATLERDDLIAFRYFYLFFRAAAFVPTPQPARPDAEPLSFLDRLREGSAAFAKEVGDRLRGHIFDEVFPYLAQGFVDYRKQKYDEKTAAGDEFLHEVHDATLTLLYRLLFLLYAESLDLLPVHEPAYAGISVTRLKEEIAAAAGNDGDTVEESLKRRFNHSDTALYQRLSKLFEVIDGQDNKLSRAHNVPAYNGGLFRTAPERNDRSREAEAARFLKKYRVPDFYLARAIDLLARDEDAKRHGELVFVDYKALGVRQLGNIYEGLLMYHVVIPRDDWERGFQREGLKVALVPSNKQRKSTGSYFTPQHIVKYIVSNTVGPLLKEKFELIAPKLRQAQREYAETREFERKRAEKMRTTPRTDDAIAHTVMMKHESTVWGLLDLKVLDPAMGSGHFLVETVDFITDKVLDFLAGFPWNPVQVLIDQRIRRQIVESLDEQGVKINEDRLTDVNLIKRLVMKRCVYGVDLNPMAVELAKVSVWLDSFTLGAPLSFLDHHLKCGNSLIGTTIAELKKTVAESGSLFAIPMEPLERATRNMETIADLTDATLTEVTKSADTYTKVLADVKGYRALLDCLTAQHFGQPQARDIVVHAESLGLKLDDWDRSLPKAHDKMRRIIQDSVRVSEERGFFHWDIDFPDVFFTVRREPDRRAFDAVVGNPPYALFQEMDDAVLEAYAGQQFKCAAYKIDTYVLFLERASGLLRIGGTWGMITPNTFLMNKHAGRLRNYLLTRLSPRFLIIPEAVFSEACVDTCVTIANRLSEPSGAYQYGTLQGTLDNIDRVSFDNHPIAPLLQDDVASAIAPVSAEAAPILSKIDRLSERLGRWFTAYFGIQTHGREEYVARSPGRGAWKPTLDGAHVDRYLLKRSQEFVCVEARAIKSGGNPAVHEATKILTRQIGAYPVFALDANKHYTLNTIYNIVPTQEDAPPLLKVLAMLNSAAIEFVWLERFFDKKEAFPKVKKDALLALPLISTATNEDRELECRAAEQGDLAKDFVSLAEAAIGEFERVIDGDLREAPGTSVLEETHWMGWDGRYPSWRPDDRTAAEGRWFPNGVAPPLEGDGPGDIPWDLIARVYPSFPLPSIDAAAWEAAAWAQFVELLRKNKSKIGNSRIRADLTGRGAVENPTGPMRKLRDTLLKYHRDIRENRAKAAEIDLLIDRIVFRLFDLTLDEQKLILSRVGPGRPLPPRRGRGRKKGTGQPDAATPGLFE